MLDGIVIVRFRFTILSQPNESITLYSFNDGIVTVNLSGACSGCPSSTITLKQGIEGLLKQKMGDKIKEVISRNN